LEDKANNLDEEINSDSANQDSGPESMELEIEHKKILIEIAKESIKNAVTGQKTNYPFINDPVLLQNCGAFVTISLNGRLRGCIGNIKAQHPLWETIKSMAKEAATGDPRFYPLNPGELKEIEIEISVLSSFKLINSIDEIKVGRHGLFIKKGYYQGLLLPQVAQDYKWDRLEFLKQTCTKAGLYESCWKEKSCEIYIFSATVFGEEV